MTTKAMSNEGGSSSGISDVKYQKAIKQISKLISLNTQLKNKLDTLQGKYGKLQQDYEKLESRQSGLNQTGMTIDSSSRLQDPPQLSNNNDFNDLGDVIEQKNNLQKKVSEKEEIIKKMKSDLQQKQKQNAEMRTKNNELKQRIGSMQQKMRKLQMSNKSEQSQKENIKLKKQLQNSQQWVRKLSSDYEVLKKQLGFNSRTSINTSSIEISSPHSSSPLENSLSQFYIERLKKSEAFNAKIKKQYVEKKEKLKESIGKLKKENESLKKKLNNLSGFIEKQQAFISKYIKTGGQENIQIE